jgi:hypothetical protein
LEPDVPQVRRENVDADAALQFTRGYSLALDVGLEVQIALPRRFVEHRGQVEMTDVHLRPVAQRRS